MMNSPAITVYLGLGSNLGERGLHLSQAMDFLSQRIKIEKESPIYDTAPVGNPNQPRFLNMVIRVSTRLPANTLLFMAKGIEAKLGRVPVDTPRPIDIDILFYGDQIINNPPQLIVPHPRLAERAFVLVPLADIAPDLLHPVKKKTIKQLLAEVEGREGVIPWGDPNKQ
ncbi:MAG: dihydropteroate synthase/2-amino-4-hydroxy-6-hydroxymethyldihydropteridine diphosphokinase [Chloroflexi bacterium]|nr:dihydropteroate synthase/2-amino-4-hydroxy-6-hydroxymethyldihydropteridine diphosphokinase [Chloroflexota bacterium]